jgi:Tol biopolymer transport system component
LRWLVPCAARCNDTESADWAPEGARVAISVSTSFVDAADTYDGLHVVDVRTGRDTRLVQRGEYAEYDWLDLDWAPNGRQLAYATTSGDIAIINADGSRHRILATGSDNGFKHTPSWSPDGRSIAYASVADGRLSSVYISRADGSARRLLARDVAAPAWSPDGTRIAVRGARHIEFFAPDGRLVAPLDVGINGTPTWSPDGTKIVFTSRRNRHDWDLYVMNADGSHVRRVLRSPKTRDMEADWQPLRP